MKKTTLLIFIGILFLLTACAEAGVQTATPIPLPPLLAGHDRTLGSTTAKVTLTEYGDFQCLACKKFAQGMAPQIWAEYVEKGKLNFEFRHVASIGPESSLAAEASECANDQGQFWPYYEKLYQEQGPENSGVFSQDNLERWAKDLKLNTDTFSQCLTSKKYTMKVNSETNAADRLNIQSTPSLAINGSLIPWDGSYASLQAMINNAINLSELSPFH